MCGETRAGIGRSAGDAEALSGVPGAADPGEGFGGDEAIPEVPPAPEPQEGIATTAAREAAQGEQDATDASQEPDAGGSTTTPGYAP